LFTTPKQGFSNASGSPRLVD